MKSVAKSIALAGLFASSMAANATVILPGSETTLQQVICNLYTAAGTPCSAAPNVNTNQYAPDQVWQIGGAGGSLATFIIQIAGLASQSTFGIYDVSNPNSRVALFDGSAGLSAGDQALVSILADGSVRKNFVDTGIDFAGNAFGYYVTAGSTTFYSQTFLNGGSDQLVVVQGDGDRIRIGGLAAGPWGSNESSSHGKTSAMGQATKISMTLLPWSSPFRECRSRARWHCWASA